MTHTISSYSYVYRYTKHILLTLNIYLHLLIHFLVFNQNKHDSLHNYNTITLLHCRNMAHNFLLLEETTMAKEFLECMNTIRHQDVNKLNPETMLAEQGAHNRNQGDVERERIMNAITYKLEQMKTLISTMKNYTSIYKSDGFHQSSFRVLEQWENQMKVKSRIILT